jgi:hypothetical protein
MNITELLEPVLTNGIRVNNFFNGRVLTAEDLRAEQQANRAQHRQLALAIGEGVVHGLEVSSGTADDGTPLLRVTPGLAFNRDGDAVALGRRTDVRLVAAEESVASEAGLFAVCQPRARALDLTNVGLYVLSASPASALSSERAPAAEVSAEGIASSCASRWAQEGVRFSVAPLPLAQAGTTPTALAAELAGIAEDVEEDVDRMQRGGASDTPTVRNRLWQNLSRLRNGAAYLCFGADTEAARRANPLPAEPGFPTPSYGAVDGMRERDELASCEVPLALFYLSKRGIEWVDAWAVRRPPVPPLTAGTLSVLPSRRREVEAVAMVLQFQGQLREIADSSITNTALAAIEARTHFQFLPPVGLVPIMGYGASRGFNLPVFFRDLALDQPVALDAAQLGSLLQSTLSQVPIDLQSRQAIQLFRVQPAGDPAAYVAFTRRGVCAVAEGDGLARSFQDAWEVYRGVLKRRLFLPLESNSDAAGARITIIAAIQDVLASGSQLAGLARGGFLDYAAALAAYDRFYTIQRELVELFESIPTNVAGSAQRREFANTLRGYLEVGIPGGISALKPAIDAGDLFGAVRAQNRINTLVGSWTGQAVAIGFIALRHTGSPEGNNLIPGSPTSFTYTFELTNSTDRTIPIQISTAVAAAPDDPDGVLHGDWAGRITILPPGASTTGVSVPTRDARSVTVEISPPGDAQDGDRLRLTVSGAVFPPNNQTAQATLDLSVSREPGEAVNRVVEIPNIVFPPPTINLTQAPGNTNLGFAFDIRYTAEDEPLTAPFTFEIVPSDAPTGWTITISGRPQGQLTTEVLLTANAPPANHRTPITIRTPAEGGRTLRFHVRVSSEEIGISGQTDEIVITTA